MTSREKSNANLIHFDSNQDREAARINGQKGGIANGVNARHRKKLIDAAKWLLQSKDIISDSEIRDKLVELGVDNPTNAEALMVIALRKASKGDVEAMKFVRDTGGEAPKNQVELSGDPDRPIAAMDLRAMSEEELLRLAEAKDGANEE